MDQPYSLDPRTQEEHPWARNVAITSGKVPLEERCRGRRDRHIGQGCGVVVSVGRPPAGSLDCFRTHDEKRLMPVLHEGR